MSRARELQELNRKLRQPIGARHLLQTIDSAFSAASRVRWPRAKLEIGNLQG